MAAFSCPVHQCGELLKDMAERGERASGANGRPNKGDSVSRLSDLGLDAKESERFQQVAAVPQKKFEAHLAAAREASGAEVSGGDEYD